MSKRATTVSGSQICQSMSSVVDRLGNHVSILSGFPFDSSLFSDSVGTPLIRIRDVGKSRANTFFDGEFDQRYLISAGEDLISMDGEFRIARWKGGPSLLNQRVCKISSSNRSILDQNYLLHFLPFQLASIEARTSFATVKHLSVKSIQEIQIPLPPLPVQQKIAAILDAADALRQKDKALLDRYDALLQSTFHQLFGDPVRNEKRWQVKRVSEVCCEIIDCVNKTAPISKDRTDFAMIRTTNIRDRELNFNDLRYVTEETFKKWTRRLVPRIGDIVFTREAPTGEAAIIDVERNLFLGQRTMIFRVDPELISNWFLLFQLTGAGLWHQIEKLSSGSTVKHLSVPMCKKFEIKVPPLSLQTHFATIAQNIQQQKAKIKAQVAKSEALFQSLLHRAFEGELIT